MSAIGDMMDSLLVGLSLFLNTIIDETTSIFPFQDMAGDIGEITTLFLEVGIPITIIIFVLKTIWELMGNPRGGLGGLFGGSRRSNPPRVRTSYSSTRSYSNPHKIKPKPEPKKEVVFKPKPVPSSVTLPVFCQIHGMTNKSEYSHKKGFLCQTCGRFVCLDCQKEISLAGMGNCPFCMNSLKSVEVKV